MREAALGALEREPLGAAKTGAAEKANSIADSKAKLSSNVVLFLAFIIHLPFLRERITFQTVSGWAEWKNFDC